MSALGLPDKSAPQRFLQAWTLLISLMCFGLYVLHDLNTLSLIVRLDRSYMVLLILALLLVATVFCGWQLASVTRRSMRLQAGLPEHQQLAVEEPQARDQWLELAADPIRRQVEIGWFLADLAIRLGLLGTIIGFILIFGSLNTIRVDGHDELRTLLIAMSGGMGTALLTTLSGLVTASILSIQYLLLDHASEHLIAVMRRISLQSGSRTDVPTLYRQPPPTLLSDP